MTPPAVTAENLRRLAASAAYRSVLRHLPWSPSIGGSAAKRLRGLAGAWMLDSCGKDVNLEHGAWFGSGRGISVGDESAIGMDCLVLGPVSIGNNVMMGPRCILLSGAHETADLSVPMNKQGFRPTREIVIEDDVWLGAAVVILPGRRIGTGAIVGAGSVVAHDVPARSIVAGNPAVVVRERQDNSHA